MSCPDCGPVHELPVKCQMCWATKLDNCTQPEPVTPCPDFKMLGWFGGPVLTVPCRMCEKSGRIELDGEYVKCGYCDGQGYTDKFPVKGSM